MTTTESGELPAVRVDLGGHGVSYLYSLHIRSSDRRDCAAEQLTKRITRELELTLPEGSFDLELISQSLEDG